MAEIPPPVLSLYAATRPTPEAAPLVLSSDILVLMLRLLAVMRAFAACPSLQAELKETEPRDALLEIERRVSALLGELERPAKR